MIRHIVTRKEPLRTEIEVFLAAVRGQDAPIVRGEDGLRALRQALAIVQSGLENRPIVTEG
jgi:predicted dehydrogenase